jgi:hypothetical protein
MHDAFYVAVIATAVFVLFMLIGAFIEWVIRRRR